MNDRPKNRPHRGKDLTLEQFSSRYDLEPAKALRLYKISGPSEYDLDLLMEAKGVAPTESKEASP
jgi:hypothetical protein